MKNKCPYIDSCKRCTHKVNFCFLRSKSKHKPNCPYNNPIKCEMYQLWIKRRKSLKNVPRAYEEYILDGGKKNDDLL